MAKAEIEQIKNQAKTKEDPLMKEKVTIKLPRLASDEAQDVYVGINGIPYKIPRGQKVEVPRAVAEILENSERMDDVNAAYIKAVTSKND